MGTKFYCTGFKSDFELRLERGISNESIKGRSDTRESDNHHNDTKL
jgi:hypothetical protein